MASKSASKKKRNIKETSYIYILGKHKNEKRRTPKLKKIIKFRAEISANETKLAMAKINKMKIWFIQKVNKR